MFYFKSLFYSLFTLLALQFVIVGCSDEVAHNCVKHRNWSEIIDSGRIRFIVLNEPPFYYKQFGIEYGYSLDIAKKFAYSNNLDYELIIATSGEDMLRLLAEGEGDIIAHNLPRSINIDNDLLFCGDSILLRSTLVKRYGHRVYDINTLSGDTIYTNCGWLNNITLNDTTNITINCIDFNNETLLADSVAMGVIDYAVMDSKLATIHHRYFNNLDISYSFGSGEIYSWCVAAENIALADSVNAWFKREKYIGSYFNLLNNEMSKYRFGSRHISIPSLATSVKDGVISPYDSWFKLHGKEVGLDWRLLAAIAYCESKFDSTVVSNAGAIGVMQVMPNTANSFGIDSSMVFVSDKNISVGARSIAKTVRTLQKDIDNPTTRIKFALAAYNAGLGHLYDAIAIAKKYGMNDTIWDGNVETAIMLKSEPQFYTDSISKFGYLRGWETRNFVKKVMSVYEYYKHNFN